MIQKYIMVVVVASLVSACSLTANPGHTKVTVPGGVTVESGGGGKSGKFCPPGQAKKGRC